MVQSKRNFLYPQLTRPRFGRERLWRGFVEFGAYPIGLVIVAHMANPWRFTFDDGAVLGDDGGFGVFHVHVLLMMVKNLPSFLNSMDDGGTPAVIVCASSCRSALP